MLAPPAPLLQLCHTPVLQATVNVRAMQDNLLAWKGAYEACAARMRCVAAWVASAKVGASEADCREQKPP